MAESILFLTGHLAKARLETVLSAMKAPFDWKVLDIGVKVAALMTEDIISAPPAEAGRGRQDHAARPLPRRSRPLEQDFRRARPARARRAQGHSRLFRPHAQSVGHDQIRHQHLRRDRRCLGALRRGDRQARARLRPEGRRRDRSRLPARHAVPASRTGDRRAEGEGLSSQRRFSRRRTNCSAAAERAPTTCSASTRRRFASRTRLLLSRC